MTIDGQFARLTPNRPANFDRLARAYRWMEWLSFGPWLQRCRCAFLHEMVECRSALVLGDGDGRFTVRLLKAAPEIRVTAIDSSPAMLRALLERAGENAARVRTCVADARYWPPAGEGTYSTPFDAVIAHFFLDCLTTGEICDLTRRIQPLLADGARFVVSDFALPAGWRGRWLARPLVGFLYRAFGWLTGLAVRTLPDHGKALEEAGFILKQKRPLLGGILVAEMWQWNKKL